MIKTEKKSRKIYPTDCNLLNLVNNLTEGIHIIKCKYAHADTKCKTCRIKYKDCEFFLEHKNFKSYLIKYKCLCSNKNY